MSTETAPITTGATPRPAALDPAAVETDTEPHAPAAGPPVSGPAASPVTAPPAGADRGRRLAALQHRDYRLYWSGSLVSQLGSQMSSVAVSWQVYQLTHDPLMLGLTGLFTVVPMVLFSLYGGVVADALDRRRMLIVTQLILLCTSLILAATTLTGVISVWTVFGVVAIQGGVAAFNNPARSALIPNLVPREHLTNAISLGVTSWQVASVVGPSLAGIIIGGAAHLLGSSGVGVVYVIDVVSYTAVIGALALIRAATQPLDRRPISLGSALEGLRFVFRNPIMSGTMLLDFFATFFGASMLLMPIFATDILHVGPQGLGFLLAAPSAGAVVSAVIVSSLGHVRRQGKVVLWSVAAYGLAWVVFGLVPNFWVALLALAGTGAADTVSMVMRQTIRQLTTPDELRGRMTSVNMIFFMGGPQLGELEGGIVARVLSAPWAAITGGLGVMVVTGLVAWKNRAVRTYEA
jgi:MFS family permease